MWKVSGKDASADGGEWSLIVSASSLRGAQTKAREYLDKNGYGHLQVFKTMRLDDRSEVYPIALTGEKQPRVKRQITLEEQPTMTLEAWSTYIWNLSQKYGKSCVLTMDAGPNNVSMELTVED